MATPHLIGCICLIGSPHCERNCVTEQQQQRRGKIDLSNTRCYRRHVLLDDPSQPPEHAMFRYVEEHIDSDHQHVAKLEAWSDGLLRAWVRKDE